MAVMLGTILKAALKSVSIIFFSLSVIVACKVEIVRESGSYRIIECKGISTRANEKIINRFFLFKYFVKIIHKYSIAVPLIIVNIVQR